MDKKLEVLERVFGYRSLRPGQESLMDACLAGRDVLGIMPTGAGKSLCFQVPALILPGVTLVVSPLISLMRDQVSALVAAGVPAAFFNSSLNERQYDKALRNARAGQYRIIYVAPERLLTPRFLSFARETEISLLVVDEAHCVSQWGQDFRPSYRCIPEFVRALSRRVPVAAFTATATRRVREDIEALLELEEPVTVITGFDRPNLFFSVQSGGKKDQRLMELLRARGQESGIIYCATRKKVESVHELLVGQGIAAVRYHAGLSPRERQESQEAFLYDRAPVMVATNAFGMGIDKSNVRFVIHYNMPQDLESYYQEAGRAGRDGEPADCILIYSKSDVQTARFLLEQSWEAIEDDELREQVRQADLERLKQMTFYATTSDCLRRFILRYFGEEPPLRCENCGNCRLEFEEIDVSESGQGLLRSVADLNQRFGAGVVVAFARGQDTAAIRRLGLKSRRGYGRLRERPGREVSQTLDLLLDRGLLDREDGEFPVLRLTEEGAEFLRDGGRLTLRRALRSREERPAETVENAELFQRLKALRLRLARWKGVPPFVIFSDATLRAMAQRCPETRLELLEVPGVGQQKLSRYGEAFLQEIQAYQVERE